MTKSLLSILIAAAAVVIMPQDGRADDAKARDIMQKVEARDDGDHMTSQLEMILIDKNKKERIRKIKSFTKDKGKDTHRLMFFIHPPEVKNTGFLTYDYEDPEKDDDQWLYLPELRKTKRIAASDKSASFMGSDLNYSDMTSRNLEDYDFSLLKEDTVDDVKVWLIQSVPRSKQIISETGYQKSILFVRQDNWVVIRAVHWEDGGNTLKYMMIKNLQQIDGIWIGSEIHMTKKRGKKTLHKTILKFNNIKFNQNLDDDAFTIRRLEKGL
jgi:outer membrane lipoprotein-sorting protein